MDLYGAKNLKDLVLMQTTGNLLEDYTRLTNNSLRLQGADFQLPATEHQRKLHHMQSLIDWYLQPSPLPFLNDHKHH